MITNDELKLVTDHIAVRLDPFIYAFSTNTIPTYLKVGDTLRGVEKRIAEWKKIISENLHSDNVQLTERYRHTALLSDEIYFRDYAVHKYLTSIGKKPIDEPLRKLYSQEFFADTSKEDVEAAIRAIEADFNSGNLAKAYDYYSVKDSKSATFHGTNDKEWRLRPNQEEVVNNFLAKRNQTELLMYAVMRFGKSFTAMYCAKAIEAKKVLIVSAKADVAGEWQKTIETPKCFKGYKFLTDKDLAKGTKISDVLTEADDSKVAVFLTLQNLAGKTEDGADIKSRLKQIFNTEFDLIIVDETHYGAWANSYGEPLKDADEDVIKEERKEYRQFGKQVARLHTKQKLHLSGTPYNLLYDNKFTADNIIATCQFKDILRDKEKWDDEHLRQIENGDINPDTNLPYQEFDNPYFGFPQMLRFAFNLPEETREKLQKVKYNWTLNDLFETVINDGTAKFIHESDVLKLLKAIDGSERVNGILGFLDIPKIKDNSVCKHMVFVLPRKYACDAMENLLREHSSEFNNLCDYKNVLNITGHSLKPELDSVDKVKSKIAEFEKKGEKTITLTVYKMLTGVTVKEWDTMFMFKNTHSAQEYDQAIFRIQNQYVVESFSPNGSVLKTDKKPQTILVDFDPVRMFTFQGLSARITDNVGGNEQSLDEAIREELNYFPIISYNADKLVKVEPTDLIELITKYNSNKGIIDSVQSVEFDKKLLEQKELLDYIKAQSPTTTKNDLDTPAHKGENKSDVQPPEDDDTQPRGNGNGSGGDTGTQAEGKIDKDLEKKYRMCIARLCFYSFLTQTNIDDLQDIIDSLKDNCKEHIANNRIFANLELQLPFVEGLKNHLSRYYELNVGDALKRANLLSKDGELTPRERALNAIKNFTRFSDSEIVTPNHICKDMVEAIGKDKLIEILNRGEKILDIASKSGEFAFAVYNLLQGSIDDGILKNGIYSIPTSGTAYEFTRRIYETLGLNVENIATPSKLTAYDLLKVTKPVGRNTEIDYDKIKLILTQNKLFSAISWEDTILGESADMIKFGAVVGNPPYQENKNDTSDNPIYYMFMNIGFASSKLACLITPARFLFNAGKTPKQWNKKMLNDEHFKVITYEQDSAKIFPSTDIKGGIAVTLRDSAQNFGKIGMFTSYLELNDIVAKVCTQPFDSFSKLVYAPESYKLSRKLHTDFPNAASKLSKGHMFDVTTNIFEKLPEIFLEKEPHAKENYIQIVGLFNKKRTYRWVKKQYIANHENLEKYKIFVPKSNGSGAIGEILSTPLIGEPLIGHTQTFISIGAFDTLYEATSVLKYVKSKFARTLLGTLKVTQDNKKDVWLNVPMQDFTAQSDIDWSKSITKIDEDAKKKYGLNINEIDAQLYKKYGLTEEEIAFIESMIKPME